MSDKTKNQESHLNEPDGLRQIKVKLAQPKPGCEDRGWITIQVLNKIKQGLSTPELLKEVVDLLVFWTGFEAVGLRLREGDDYPYFQTRGMSEEFIRLENSLCPQGHVAEPEGAGDGNLILECACGSVLQGSLDRSQPFITEYGSLWTNSNTQLLDERPELRDAIRGNCVRAGYETSALIPLRFGDQTFGLLQFEDKRPGMLSEELLATLESISLNLALALSQRQYADELRKEKETLERRVQERTIELTEANAALLQVIEEKEKVEVSLRQSDSRFRSFFNLSLDGIFSVNLAGRFSSANPASERISGYTEDELRSLHFLDICAPECREATLLGFERGITTAESNEIETALISKEGRIVNVLIAGSPILVSGRVEGLFCIARDITEQERPKKHCALASSGSGSCMKR